MSQAATGAQALVRFRPQAWVNDHAIEVDPEGDDTWLVDESEVAGAKHPGDLDDLKGHPNAPEWVRAWPGPFDLAIADQPWP